MTNFHTVFEITNDKIRLITGYVSNGEPVIIHSASKEIKGMVKDNQIIDPEGIILAIKQLAYIKNKETRLFLEIKEATIILPPLGFCVFASRKTTNVVSPSNVIEDLDISNVINLVKKDPLDNGSAIVDIIPISFTTGDGISYYEAPKTKRSSTLEIYANIHTLPKAIIDSYENCFKKAGINVTGKVVATYALSEFAKKNPDFPKSYLLVDMGHAMTTFGCIGSYLPYGSQGISGGIDGLVAMVSEKFGVSLEESLNLLNVYGIDKRESTFHPYIASHADEEGHVVRFTQEHLNIMITNYMEEYFAKFISPMEVLCKATAGDASKAKTLPIIFTGSLIRIPGIKEMINEHFSGHSSIHFLRSDTIGASRENFCACVGGLLIANKKNGSLSNVQNKVGPVTRS